MRSPTFEVLKCGSREALPVKGSIIDRFPGSEEGSFAGSKEISLGTSGLTVPERTDINECFNGVALATLVTALLC